MTQPDKQLVGTVGPVLIIGAGLIGGSIGMALTRASIEVYLRDISPTSLSLAQDLDAGIPWSERCEAPRLVIVATPPDVCADFVLSALREFPCALVFDVSSVKKPVLDEVVAAAPQDASRYCSVHPMAGKEVSGVGAASPDLFEGRPWVVVATPQTGAAAARAAKTLGIDLGAFTLTLDGASHDLAVAYVSHVPQLISSLMGGILTEASPEALELAGSGLRDVTRIAASDPRLWNAILAGNQRALREVLELFYARLGDLLRGLREETGTNTWNSAAVGAINTVLTQGNAGVARIPGKHGDTASKYGVVTVVVPDEPGFLGRLFQEVGNAGVNVEDFRLEHALGQARGLAWLYVEPSTQETLQTHLRQTGWSVVTL